MRDERIAHSLSMVSEAPLVKSRLVPSASWITVDMLFLAELNVYTCQHITTIKHIPSKGAT